MFGFFKKNKKKLKASGSLVENAKDEKRTPIKITSRQKDILTSLFDLPIRQEWLDEEAIDKILRDSTVSAAIGSRKAATLKKEILITCKDDNMKERLEAIFDYDTLDSVLDTPYQGFSVFELNWQEEIPSYPRAVERYHRNFSLQNGVLKYEGNGVAEDIQKHKAVYLTYKAKPDKPYGQDIYNTLFWLIEFKTASMEFWVDLLERFGTPWVVGKTEGSKNQMANELYEMLGGGVAAIDVDDEIDITTATDKGNFKEIVEYLDDQIREVILGGNLTGQVKGGSQAAATVHNDIREDLARADENVVNKFIKNIIDNFKEINHINENITGLLKDKDDPNKELVDRDKVIYDMGYQPTQEYLEKTYNIKLEKVEKQEEKQEPISNNAKANELISLSNKNIYVDELDKNASKIDIEEIALTFQKQIVEVMNNSDSYEEMIDKLYDLYPNMNTTVLENTLFQNLANAKLLAVAQIEDENPNG